MVARGPGDVGCAHCTQIGATEVCQVCTHLVCPRCAADWKTCPQPSGRVIRLGMGHRLRDVDPLGQLGIVSHPLARPRLLDLRQLRWAPGRFPLGLNYYNALADVRPRVSSDGYLVHPGFDVTNGNNTYFNGVVFHELRSAREAVKIKDCERPHHATAMSSVGDLFSYVSDTQHVVVMAHQLDTSSSYTPTAHAWESPADVLRLRQEWEKEHPRLVVTRHAFDSLPRQVVQQQVVDGARHLLASGTWRLLALHHFDLETGKLERLSQIDTKIDGNMMWLGLSGRWIAYAVGSRDTIEVRALGDDHLIGDVAYRHVGPFKAAALSNDGRHLAVAFGTKLIVHDLDRDTRQEFTEHTDAISYVRFAAESHVLISADDDNRVILRPRTEDGYARPLIAIDLKN